MSDTHNLTEWMNQKLAEAEKALRCREAAAEPTPRISDEEWERLKAMPGTRVTNGRKLSKAALKEIEMEPQRQKRIAVKCRQEVAMWKMAIAELLASQARELGLREALKDLISHAVETPFANNGLKLAVDSAQQVLSAPLPDVVRREEYDALAEANAQLHLELLDANAAIAMMNERLEERTQGLLDTAAKARLARSAPSFRAGWAACIAHEQMSLPDVEQALQEYTEAETAEK